jgi:hypothetical protein
VFFSGTENVGSDLQTFTPVINHKYNSAATTDLTITIKGKTDFSPKLKPHGK